MTDERYIWVNVTDEEGILQGRFQVSFDEIADIAEDSPYYGARLETLRSIGERVIDELPSGYRSAAIRVRRQSRRERKV